jgi:hypothetical protein
MAAQDSNSGAQVITRPAQLRLKVMGPTSVSITTLVPLQLHARHLDVAQADGRRLAEDRLHDRLVSLRSRAFALTTAGSRGCTACNAQGEAIAAADVIIAVAGMEGALASVVAGLFPRPVVAAAAMLRVGERR